MRDFEGIPVWGDPVDDQAVRQMRTCSKDAFGAALMADHHVGYSMPIGGVVAHRDRVSPSGVGYDIGCGNKAVLTDVPGREIRQHVARVMYDVFAQIPFGTGRGQAEPVDHELFDDDAWNDEPAKSLKQKARSQLGTVGGGNHYVDLFLDESDRVWISVHFGSRGFGHGVASHFMKAGGGQDGMFVEPVEFEVGSDLGQAYLAQMELAGRYAYAGRDWVCDRVLEILGAAAMDVVHNHHNYAWREEHAGESVWVVRKGATPAFPGQRGFVGGSMGDDSVILEGLDTDEARKALHSTVHGAGRRMSRTKAAGKLIRKGPNKGRRTGGHVTREEMMKWVDRKGVELRGADLDESPQCYKRLDEVLRHHAGSVRVLHTLKPIGVAMAGPDVIDPYRD